MSTQSRNKKLSEKDHILQRSGMYLGSKTLKTLNEYIIVDGKFQYTEVTYVPGLIKICNELIDNSLDEHQRTGGKFATKIDINIDSTSFSVSDNGRGIPVVDSEDEHGNVFPEPELVWTHARAGSNFDDDEKTEDESATIGTNGVGSMIASVFSKSFIGVTDDGKKRCKVTCTNNNETIKTTYQKTFKNGTSVTIEPDLARFSLTEIDQTHIDVLKQRIFMLSVSYPNIAFKFNGERIRLNNKQFVSMFGDSLEVVVEKDYTVAVLPNVDDDFRHYSILNGLNLRKGGSHVTLITNHIVNRLREKLKKKYKEIKPGDIRNKMFVVTVFNKFSNAAWDGQTKEDLANSTKEIQDYMGDFDYDKLALRILKNDDIIDPITEVYKIKAEFAKRQALKNADKKSNKKPESEKFMPPIGDWKRCFVCEGDSAANSMSKLLGRDGNGYYAMFGVPPNAYSAKMSDILKSVKMMDLKDILGLKFSSTVQDELNFEEIIITTDYDLPGHFIAGQLLGLFYRFGKNLFEEKRIKRLVTPLMLATDRKEKIVAWFYTFEDYQAFEEKNKSKNYNYDYKKGLGSWDPEELDVVIAKDGLENMLEVFELDAEGIELIEDWLGNDAQKRKDQLDGVEFNMMTV